jgi:hypothetical protein
MYFAEKWMLGLREQCFAGILAGAKFGEHGIFAQVPCPTFPETIFRNNQE